MKRRLAVLILSIFVLAGLIPHVVKAQNTQEETRYIILDYKSNIEVRKNASLLVTETITVNFPFPKHGIFRIVPIRYSAYGKTINARFKLISVRDEEGNPYKFSTSNLNQSMKIKIGDPDYKISGIKTYVITYQLSKILLRYKDHDEVFWNVTGNEWDTGILNTSATVDSPFATVTDARCYTGEFGSKDKNCTFTTSSNQAFFNSEVELGNDRNMSVVVALDKDNLIEFPGPIESFWETILDNWMYGISLLPILIITIYWYLKGRDKKFTGDNVYYKQKDVKEIDKPLFAREHLPMVYSPIQGLTPSEVGTIVDEKVDIEDVVAEIVELARLGYLKIEKLDKDSLFLKKEDYAFVKLKKDESRLKDYQKYLLEKLFNEKALSKSATSAEDIKDNDVVREKETVKRIADKSYVLLSSLKNNFYSYLDDYKDKLYKDVYYSGFFVGDPEKVRKMWLGLGFIFWFGAFMILNLTVSFTGNYFPIVLLLISTVPGFFIIRAIPRKTAYGHSIYRQIKGLAFYLKKGKWRYEVQEKHLFFEEVLPLAISLGVVSKLAKDMQGLSVPPPNYLQGFAAGSLSGDIGSFSRSTSSSFVSSPQGKWSGSSSWSGGSGFSGGGFSGGGFGGGGGGSW